MWDERYSKAFNAYGTEPNDFLREVASKLPDGPVLCLAEGEGRNAVFLAQRGHAVTAVDQSEVGLKNAERLASDRGVSLSAVTADLADYDFGESKWSGIVSIWCHLPPALRLKVHAACVRALKPGGVFILEAYTPRQLERPGVGGPPTAELLMDPQALQLELKGLELEHCLEVEREVQEGEFHRGPSTTVQILARKPQSA